MTVKPLTGATRIHAIVGDPIAQVKSPTGVTNSMRARGADAILIPVQVAPDALDTFFAGAKVWKNLDGVLVTVPHKFACFDHCASTTARATFLKSVNAMRRRADGEWHGEHVDGLGFVGAAMRHGHDPKGLRTLLIGAGGAGSAIALALVEAGVSELAIHDADTARRDALIAALNGLGKAPVTAGSTDPTGFAFVANATPMGMKPSDPLPFDAAKLAAETYVGCVITQPVISPIVAAARAKGCPTGTGSEMFAALQEMLVDFLLHAEGNAP